MCCPYYRQRFALNKTCPNPSMTTQTTFDPMLSIFDSAEEEADYTAWLRDKLQASIDDPSPSIPHEQVMAEMRERLAQIKARKSQQSA